MPWSVHEAAQKKNKIQGQTGYNHTTNEKAIKHIFSHWLVKLLEVFLEGSVPANHLAMVLTNAIFTQLKNRHLLPMFANNVSVIWKFRDIHTTTTNERNNGDELTFWYSCVARSWILCSIRSLSFSSVFSRSCMLANTYVTHTHASIMSWQWTTKLLQPVPLSLSCPFMLLPHLLTLSTHHSHHP